MAVHDVDVLVTLPEQGGSDRAPLVGGPEDLAVAREVSAIAAVIVLLALIGDMDAAVFDCFLVIVESELIMWKDHLVSPNLFKSIYVRILVEVEGAWEFEFVGGGAHRCVA